MHAYINMSVIIILQWFQDRYILSYTFPLLRHSVKNKTFMQWLRDNGGLTTELVEAAVEPYAAQHVENLWIGTTWNKAARRCHNEWEHSLGSRVLFRGTVIANAAA